MPRAADATTWHVTYDPAQPEDRVGTVAALAVSGDSILIDPGTYYEHIPLEGKSLTFVGLQGPTVTILDGSRTLPGREGGIIYTLTGTPADLVVEGLTFRSGTGAHYPESVYNQLGGGAILWWEIGHSSTASLAAVNCAFEDNVTGDPIETFTVGGGAIFADDLESVTIEKCAFVGNVSINRGSDLGLLARTATVTECSFQIDEGGAAGGVSIDKRGGGTLTIEECSFQAQWGDGQRIGIYADVDRLDVLDSQFVDRGGPLATCFALDCLCVGPIPQDVLISGNVLWNAAGPDSAAEPTLSIWTDGAIPIIRQNTFVRCGVVVHNGSEGGTLVFENNIVARAKAKFHVPPGGDYSCNDFWLASVTDYIGNLTHSGNTTDNSFFCDEANGDFTLSEGSPCAPSGDCDLMGAEPVACNLGIHACCVGQECVLATEEECADLGGHWMIDPPLTSCEPDACLTAARKTTWGAMKALFRGDAK